MSAARWLGVGVLVNALWGCGDDGAQKPAKEPEDEQPAQGDGSEEPDDGLVDACDLVSADTVSELLGVTLMAAPNDSSSASVCIYEKKGIPTQAGIRIEYTGAQNFEQTREAIVSMYGGTASELSGLGEAAFAHSFERDFGDVVTNVITLVAIQGEVLVGVTVEDVDLGTEAGVEMAREVMTMVLPQLE